MFSNIWRLGIKELRCLLADRVLLIVIVWAFTVGIYAAATGVSRELHNAPLAIVDLDRSPLSEKLAQAFYPPYFRPPRDIPLNAMDVLLDRGQITFALVIPEHFQRDFLAGHRPALQVNIDATHMSQSFIGATYIQNIVADELNELDHGASSEPPIRLVPRVRFNPNLNGLWFGGVMEVINNITMLSIVLVGAAFIREREHGTLEHLLVMPVSPFEMMAAKVWANGLVVLLAATLGLKVVVEMIMQVPVQGSLGLFVFGAALYLFSTASMGIYLGTLARSMPQFGLLLILTVLPLELLSGGVTPRESMPELVQHIMLLAPTTHFVKLAQTILYRGGGFDLIWPQLLAITAIGIGFQGLALRRVRKTVAQVQ